MNENTGRRATTGPTNVMNVDHDDYTWDMAERDLVFMTRLNLGESASLIRPLRATGLHPYDAMPALGALVSTSVPATMGEALYALITGKPYDHWLRS